MILTNMTPTNAMGRFRSRAMTGVDVGLFPSQMAASGHMTM